MRAAALAMAMAVLVVRPPAAAGDCSTCEPTLSQGDYFTCAPNYHKADNSPSASCVACGTDDDKACLSWEQGTVNSGSDFTEIRLADTENAEACAALVRATQPTATSVSWGDAGVKLNRCWAGFGAGPSVDFNENYRVCIFSAAGPGSVARRDVVFTTGGHYSVGAHDVEQGNKFAFQSGETWAVGQVVKVTDKGGAGSCQAAENGGQYVVEAVWSTEVVLQTIADQAAPTSNTIGAEVNNDCQVEATSNLISSGGGPCEPCPAGKEPGTGADVGLCVDCPPGKHSDNRGTCHSCPAGTAWRLTAADGNALSQMPAKCTACDPGKFLELGLTTVAQNGVVTKQPMLSTATCVARPGRWGGATASSREMSGSASTIAECAALVMANRGNANGVHFCSSSSNCYIEGCFAITDLGNVWGVGTQDDETCFLDLACQSCPAGTRPVVSPKWTTGDGIGSHNKYISDEATREACVEKVRDTEPLANGVSYPGRRCYAIWGMNGRDGASRASLDGSQAIYVSSYLAPESFEAGWATYTGYWSWIGRADTATDCAAKVREQPADSNGDSPNGAAFRTDGGSGCWAEFEMISSTDIPKGQWQTAFFENTGCEACPAGKVSLTDGGHCENCASGYVPSSDKSECVACDLGKVAAPGETMCTPCPTGQVSSRPGEACVACTEAGKRANDAQSGCVSCPAGTKPADDRSSCVDCTDTTYSAFGIECSECSAPNVVNSGRTTCTACAAGTGPNADRTGCISCTGTTYSTIGQCQDCDAPSVVDSGHQTCTSCAPGEEPNGDRTGCVACTGTTYSGYGITCAECNAPNVVNSGRTTCTACAAGTGPNADRTGCISCTGTTYSTIGQCQDCDAPSVVDSGHQTCTSCAPGEEPNGDRTGCVACTGTTYSGYGITCAECNAPNVINTQRTTCSACSPGQEPNSNRDDCVACTGATYSPYGALCQECASPNSVGSDKITCSRGGCSLGQECTATAAQCISDSATNCADCVAGKYSDGGECIQCEPGKVPNDAKSACNGCTPGSIPNAAATACESCPQGKYSAYGVACNACPLGKYADAVADCTANCGEMVKYPRSGCSSCDGGKYVYSPAAEAAWRNAIATYDEMDRNAQEEAMLYYEPPPGDIVNEAPPGFSPPPPGYDEPPPGYDEPPAEDSGGDSQGLVCGYTDDGECDETDYCPAGSDSNDCCTGTTVTDPGRNPNADCSNAGRRRRMQDPVPAPPPPAPPPTCATCPGGFVPKKTQDGCDECANGKVSEPGDSICESCPDGSESYFDSLLTPRPSGWIDPGGSSGTSQSKSKCVCEEGHYNYSKYDSVSLRCHESDFKDDLVAESTNECRSCGSCLACYRGIPVIELNYIPVWTDEDGSGTLDIFRCPGGADGCHTDKDLGALSIGCKTCANPTKTLEYGCLGNYAGHMCQTCKDNYEPKKVDGVEKCVQCPPRDGKSFKVMGGFFAFFAFLFIIRKSIKKFILARLGENELVAERRIKTIKATLRSAWQPVRICISYAQVTSQLGPVLDIPYPPMFQGLSNWLRDSLEVLDVFASAKCLGIDTYHNKYLMQVLALPTVLVAVAYLVFLIQRHSGDPEAGKNFKGACFFIAFFCYPKMCNFSFAAFICRVVHRNPTISILIADDRVLCEELIHSWFQYCSMAIIVLVAAGVPVATAVFLRRDAMSRQERGVDDSLKREVAEQWQVSLDEAEIAVNDTRLGSSYGFLVDAFKPRFYYAESLDMIRKLMLVGIVLVVERGSVAQLLVALLISIVFTTGHANTWPYKIHEDNLLRLSTEFHIFILIGVAIAFKTDLDSPWAVAIKGGQACDLECKSKYFDDITVRKNYYDAVLIVSFALMVPGALIATVWYKARSVMRALRSIDKSDTDGTQGMIMKSAYQRYKLGLVEGSDHKDLVHYFDSLDVSKHVRAGQELWRSKQMVSHYTNADVSRMAEECQQMIPKSETIGLHFTDLNSARLILHSKGIRASTVGQLGGGVSICLSTLSRLGWGSDSYTKNVGDALWGSKWHEVMEGFAPLMKLRIKAPQHELNAASLAFGQKQISSCPLFTELKADLAAALNTNDSSTIVLSAEHVKIAGFTRDGDESATIEFFLSPPELTQELMQLLPKKATSALFDLLEQIQDLDDDDFIENDMLRDALGGTPPAELLEQFQAARAELIRTSLAASRAKLRSELGNPSSTLMNRPDTGAKYSVEPGQELTLEPQDEICAVGSAASSSEWGSWGNKLEVVFFVRIPSRENRDPARIVPGRDDVYIVPKSDCVPDDRHEFFFLSNTKIIKCLILKPPSTNKIEESRKFIPRWIPCKPSQAKASRKDYNLFKSTAGDEQLFRKESVTEGSTIPGPDLVKQVRHELVGQSRSKYRITYDCVWPPKEDFRVVISSLGTKVGMSDNFLSKVKLTDRVDDFMLDSSFPPRLRRTVATIGPARQENDPILTLHHKQNSAVTSLWAENIARFTKEEMRAAIKALDQELLQSYSLGFYYCSMNEAQELCSSGSGISGTCTPLAPTEVGWEKNAKGQFKEKALEAMDGTSAGPVEAVLVFAVPNCDEISRGSRVTLDLNDESIFSRIRMIEKSSDGNKEVSGLVDIMDAALTLTFESLHFQAQPDGEWQMARVESTDREHNLIDIEYGNDKLYTIPRRYMAPRSGVNVAQTPADQQAGLHDLETALDSQESGAELVYSNVHIRKWYRLIPEDSSPDAEKRGSGNIVEDTTEKPPDSVAAMTQPVSYLEAIPFALQLASMVRTVVAWRKRSNSSSTVVPADGTTMDELEHSSTRSASYTPADTPDTNLAPAPAETA